MRGQLPYGRGQAGDNGMVASYAEVELSDGIAVRFEVSPGGGEHAAAGTAEAAPPPAT